MSRGRWSWRLLLAGVAVLAVAAAWGVRLPCRQGGWLNELPAAGVCYSDLPALYTSRGMAFGSFPYLDDVALLEYPVLLTAVAVLTGLVVYALSGGAVAVTSLTSLHAVQSMYFDVNAVLLAAVWAGAVLMLDRLVERRELSLAAAAAPAVVATGAINWDLWPVAAAVGALLAFRRRRWVLGGVLVGVGTALKLWPLLLLGALMVLAVRTRRRGPAVRAILAAAATWIVLNVPLALLFPYQWGNFWTFSGVRGAGFSSVYHVWSMAVAPVLGLPPLADGAVNILAYGLFLLACVGILVLGVRAHEQPSIEQLSFLIVGAFVLTNKVYSPQFALWLTPLMLLALPSLRAFWPWQLIEVVHWLSVALWLHASSWRTPLLPLASALYVAFVGLHVIALGWLMGRVAWRMRREPSSSALQGAREAAVAPAP